MINHPLMGLINAVRAHQANPVFSTRFLLVFKENKVHPSMSCVTLRTDQALLDIVAQLAARLDDSPTALASAPYAARWTLEPPGDAAVVDSRVVVVQGGLYLTANWNDAPYRSERIPLGWFDRWRNAKPAMAS